MGDQVHKLKVIIVNRALIQNKEGKYLFIQRASNQEYEADKWELPGGKMDQFETLEEHVIREVYEETGLVIHPLKIANYISRLIIEVFDDLQKKEKSQEGVGL